MRRAVPAWVLLSCLLLALPPGRGAAQTGDCTAPTTQATMNLCAMEAWLAADDALNAAYARAVSAIEALDPDGSRGLEALLREAQRAWIVFRDAACEAEAALYAGGSIEPLIRATCLERLTVERTRDLLAYGDEEK
ncbi:Uncharacterized protein putative in bacteria [Rubellimicrobium thermophilum DSM 16684]|uniref:Uncharacterized protein putative in bacteria n=1 Tax=Rubellimicrobium thermophilum DSM 16684 TaxID=1123069 RepID=S9S826_9RHOB|nr:lysozyme inhibitor LprI family protein [Rubellimicrobium thermophilum]EPX86330.1 Uncharacterized protein putative in bacteria [Rubellimicrobium thermophilum DSM 16684]